MSDKTIIDEKELMFYCFRSMFIMFSAKDILNGIRDDNDPSHVGVSTLVYDEQCITNEKCSFLFSSTKHIFGHWMSSDFSIPGWYGRLGPLVIRGTYYQYLSILISMFFVTYQIAGRLVDCKSHEKTKTNFQFLFFHQQRKYEYEFHPTSTISSYLADR